MKRFALIILMSVAALSLSAQTKTFAVLGDSYSTFQGYIPAGNAIWYFDGVQNKDNDVVKVEQTWWYQLAQQTGYKLVMNDSYSGATIAHTGYRGEDYADRSFMTRMYNLRNHRSEAGVLSVWLHQRRRLRLRGRLGEYGRV